MKANAVLQTKEVVPTQPEPAPTIRGLHPRGGLVGANHESTAAEQVVSTLGDVPPGEEDAGHPACEGHIMCAREDGAGQCTRDDQSSTARPVSLLNVYASNYEGWQKERMAAMGRLRSWLMATIPREEWGSVDFSDEKLNDRVLYEALPNDMRPMVDQIVAMESAAERYLRREIHAHPLWPWFAEVRGIGEVLAGRLMHHLGDLKRFPTPAHLWSYCGLDGPQWKRLDDIGKRTYSAKLNKLAWQVSKSFSMQPVASGGYRDIYDRRKAYEASKPWCGKCRPAREAKDAERETCIPAHIDNKAKRYAAKRFLADLWQAGQ